MKRTERLAADGDPVARLAVARDNKRRRSGHVYRFRVGLDLQRVAEITSTYCLERSLIRRERLFIMAGVIVLCPWCQQRRAPQPATEDDDACGCCGGREIVEVKRARRMASLDGR